MNYKEIVDVASNILSVVDEEMNRGTGRTTRLVDKAIQTLFTDKIVLVRDHFNSREAHKHLADRIMDRMHYEHPGVQVEKLHVKDILIIKLIEDE